jgi:hypothetical protein
MQYHGDLRIERSLNLVDHIMEGSLAQSPVQPDCSTQAGTCSRQLGQDIDDRKGVFQSFC